MYNQLLYYILVIMMFTTGSQAQEPAFPPVQTLLLCLGVLVLYAVACRSAFGRLQKSLNFEHFESIAALRFHSIQGRLNILALGAVAVDVYGFGILFYLRNIPGLGNSLTLPGLAGIILFLIHATVLWLFSYPVYRRIHHSDVGVTDFLVTQVSQGGALLVPWVLISLLLDVAELIHWPKLFGLDLGDLLTPFLILVFFLFAPVIIVRLWRCRPLADSAERRVLERFCEEHGFRVGGLLLWPQFGQEVMTAGVVGILPPWRYILVTAGLLRVLDFDELKSVLAHEMGHVRKLHLVIFLVFFAVFSAAVVSTEELLRLALLQNQVVLGWAASTDGLLQGLFSLVDVLPTILLFILFFRYIFGFFLRNSERQADLYSMELIGNPYALISSFEKIAFYAGRIDDLPSWHHYSIRQRIRFLGQAFENRTIIKQHNRKLYGAALLFLALMAALSYLGFNLSTSDTVQGWRARAASGFVETRLQTHPNDPALLSALGGILLEQGKVAEAEPILRKAVKLRPDDPLTKNNLAWLLATAPPPLRSPAEALELARSAVSMREDPSLLDTLAEAFYVNGRYREAIEVIDQAIGKDGEKRDYLLGQKKKFEAARVDEEKAMGRTGDK